MSDDTNQKEKSCYCGNDYSTGDCSLCGPIGSRYYSERISFEKITQLEKELAEHKAAEIAFHNERDALLARNTELEAIIDNPKEIESALLKRRTKKLNALILEHDELKAKYSDLCAEMSEKG